jgi:hypothetical protein
MAYNQSPIEFLAECCENDDFVHIEYLKEAFNNLIEDLQLSDEIIVNSAWEECNMDHPNFDNTETMRGFIMGCKYYRKKIKNITLTS